jgi:hypothetical protein
MNVQLLDIDLEVEQQETKQKERTFFGYNRVDMGMLVLCAVMLILFICFFIWFGVQHSK